jgi:hypothetical protein
MTSDLLAPARALLDGRTPIPAGQRAFLAAALARQALEDTVERLCAHRFGAVGHPVTMGSRLIMLGTVLDQQTMRAIEIAWAELSAACHHHAYELTPTTAEIGHLIDLVADLPTTPTGMTEG